MSMIGAALHDNLETLERRLGRPRANRFLPDEIRLDEIRSWLHLAKEAERVKAAEWQRQVERDVAIVLRRLISNFEPMES